MSRLILVVDDEVDRLTSLKRRLSVIILASIGTSVAIVTVGRGFGIGWLLAAGLGAGVALLLVRSLARGTTSRLRDLAAATDAIASGDHDHRIEVRGRDEIGHLAAAFNEMAQQLGEIDRMRRSLIADASHELRTPIAAARAWCSQRDRSSWISANRSVNRARAARRSLCAQLQR